MIDIFGESKDELQIKSSLHATRNHKERGVQRGVVCTQVMHQLLPFEREVAAHR